MGPSQITSLLKDWAAGSESARAALIPLVYSDLKVLSHRMLGREGSSQLNTTGLVHDLYLKLAKCEAMEWQDRHHFFSFCARVMRQILTDQARARLTDKRNALLDSAIGLDQLPWVGEDATNYLDLHHALDRLTAMEPEKAAVVELRFYLGCTAEETAEILGVGKATVDRHMAFARAWLYQQIVRPPSAC